MPRTSGERKALETINSVPIVDAQGPDDEDFVFSVNGRTPFQGWSKAKSALDEKMLGLLRQEDEEVEWRDWQHRDLRRTAKTLMARAAVSRDHVIGGVEGVYDRHDYLREKRDAFDRLAALVESIVTGGDNGVALPTGRV